MNEIQEKDRKGEEPRQLKNADDQEDGGDGVTAKESLTEDKLKGDDEREKEERGGERQ